MGRLQAPANPTPQKYTARLSPKPPAAARCRVHRAYKLGKKRWSYNQVELRLEERGGGRRAVVTQAAHAADAQFPKPCQVRRQPRRRCAGLRAAGAAGPPVCRPAGSPALAPRRPPPHAVPPLLGRLPYVARGAEGLTLCPPSLAAPASQDSAVCFHLQLDTGRKLQAHVYIVYDGQPAARGTPAAAEAGGGGADAPLTPVAQQQPGEQRRQDGQQQQQQQDGKQQQEPQRQDGSGQQYEW